MQPQLPLHRACCVRCIRKCSTPFHSSSSSLSVPSGPPQNLVVSSRTATSVTLTWSDPAPDKINDRDGVTGFVVRRDGVQVGTVTVRTITFTGLSVSTSYSFEVLAINQQGTAPANHAARLTVTTASEGVYTSELTTSLHLWLSACSLPSTPSPVIPCSTQPPNTACGPPKVLQQLPGVE